VVASIGHKEKLLTSTLETYFQGRKDLSKGLAMEQLPLYWFGSGTPTYLIEVLNKFGVLPSPIGGNEAVAADFDAPTERMESKNFHLNLLNDRL
jgi:hypothetical protein